ncbi:hypothetical protein [Flavobacterium sp. LM4]|uniref:hypothetical protein n=1 Tax=Flavobacterium sp. LM4 TaxID=1938609 RepID=UPI001CB93205|nr:hypothetical protein [Flavobacterium sp. LM4]
MKKIIRLTILFLSFAANSQIKLPRLISDGMILQRDAKVKIWGWAAANEKIELNFNSKIYKTITAEDGTWMIILPPQKAGGPYEMTFSSSNTITLKNILLANGFQ